MLYLSQPPELRAQTGNTGGGSAASSTHEGKRRRPTVCSQCQRERQASQTEDIGDLRFQEGTWVCSTHYGNDEGQPLRCMEIVRGRLGVISAISGAQLNVRLLHMSFKPTPFALHTAAPIPSQARVYTSTRWSMT